MEEYLKRIEKFIEVPALPRGHFDEVQASAFLISRQLRVRQKEFDIGIISKEEFDNSIAPAIDWIEANVPQQTTFTHPAGAGVK